MKDKPSHLDLPSPDSPRSSISRKHSRNEKYLDLPGGSDSPRASISRKPSHSERSASTSKSDARSQKEKEIQRELKQVLRGDSWKMIPDLLTEWEVISARDILVECGIQFLHKERSLCERTLEHCIKRGPLKYNEYTFASGIVHLAECQFHLRKMEDCTNTLIRALKYIDREHRPLSEKEDKDRRANMAQLGLTPASESEWTELKDWTCMFLAVMDFRSGNYDDTLRMLDTAANYQLVLKPARFAFIMLLKAKSFIEIRQPDEALRILRMRQSQEDALSQIGTMSLGREEKDGRQNSNTRHHSRIDDSDSPPGTPRKRGPSTVDDASDALTAVHACHDLHILLMLDKDEDEAKDMFKEMKMDGSKRPPTLKEFAKKANLRNVGDKLIDNWLPSADELTRQM
ncbi:hypothetical protein CcCBS67573_g02502 [Chytriomyces confervae]|uniref:Uncharacterized protein n=1 Tax=Chytriomyces confervae TaxID=246404 RepID=A0A507FIU1_9FUNG|nr:hypothetical protein CcCBS67573_g02502 [Chytriomyces confervae]